MIEAWMAAALWLTDWLATSSFPTLLSAQFLSLLFVWLNANDYRLLLLFKIGSNRISHEFFAGRILLSSFSATTQVTSQRRATAFLLFFMRKRKMNKEFNAIVHKYLYQCCACAIQSFRSHSIMVVFFVIVWSCYELFVLHLSIPPCAHNITFIQAFAPFVKKPLQTQFLSLWLYKVADYSYNEGGKVERLFRSFSKCFFERKLKFRFIFFTSNSDISSME